MIKTLRKKRKLLFLIADIFLIILAIYLSFLLRFEGQIPASYFSNIIGMIILALLSCLPLFYFFRLYSFSWAYVSTQELISLSKAIALAFIFSGTALFVLKGVAIFSGFPRSTFFISFFLIFIFSGGIRFTKRIHSEIFLREGGGGKERTLIVGAGDAGEQILRNILSLRKSPYTLVGFADDDPAKKDILIHGIKVLGKIEEIPKIIGRERIEQMIIALPSAGSKVIRRAVELGRQSKLKKIKIVPSFGEIINGQISIGNLREVEVEDLLGREPVSLDTKLIENFIKGKNVLITGAAGSIGSELSRQVAKFSPSSLLLLDQDETGIFNILKDLKDKFSQTKILASITDILDKKKIDRIFQQFLPQIIFHAAAYKHVPLMEENPDEAVKNNIFGTKTVAESSFKYGAEKFIFISTDKAVKPTSVMGASKRFGEMICQTLDKKRNTQFVSVRFGNVLDSRGSVIPIFREQIKRGGPVEITHPEMKRYFMTTSEACLLVMQASAMGRGGEVFVLNMGKPIKILDLAKEMIRLSGSEPDRDIPLVFTEPRPGEKFFEEILTAEEGTIATQNQEIFMAKLSQVDEGKLSSSLAKLQKAVDINDKSAIIKTLKETIPFYHG